MNSSASTTPTISAEQLREVMQNMRASLTPPAVYQPQNTASPAGKLDIDFAPFGEAVKNGFLSVFQNIPIPHIPIEWIITAVIILALAFSFFIWFNFIR